MSTLRWLGILVVLGLLLAVTAVAGELLDGRVSPPPMPGRLPARLRLVRSEPAPSWEISVSHYGLTGANKPSGTLSSRLRSEVPADTPQRLRHAGVRLVEKTEEGWVAIADSAGGTAGDGTEYPKLIFTDPEGRTTSELLLRKVVSQPAAEIQDLRVRRGLVYFNEACPSYSAQLGGRCSTLTAYDPHRKEVLWRTPWLTSNNVFIFLDDETILCGYGFTDERDFLFLVDARRGTLLGRTPIRTAHEYLEVADARLHVFTYDTHYVFELPAKSRAADLPP